MRREAAHAPEFLLRKARYGLHVQAQAAWAKRPCAALQAKHPFTIFETPITPLMQSTRPCTCLRHVLVAAAPHSCAQLWWQGCRTVQTSGSCILLVRSTAHWAQDREEVRHARCSGRPWTRARAAHTQPGWGGKTPGSGLRRGSAGSGPCGSAGRACPASSTRTHDSQPVRHPASRSAAAFQT